MDVLERNGGRTYTVGNRHRPEIGCKITGVAERRVAGPLDAKQATDGEVGSESPGISFADVVETGIEVVVAAVEGGSARSCGRGRRRQSAT